MHIIFVRHIISMVLKCPSNVKNHAIWVLQLPGCYIRTVHVTSFLQKSADFRSNLLRISVKVCAEIHGSSVGSPRDRLLGSAESFFGNPRNCLSGARGFALWESSKRSLGDRRLSSPRNRLQESAKSSFECSMATLQRIIFSTGTYGGSVDTQQCFRV